MALAARMDTSPSKLLLPLSFASMFGGVCTLLGTSTNILVSSIAADNGLQPFSMFEFTPFGLIIVAAGFIYLYFFGIDMVPPRRETTDLSRDFNTVDYLSDVRVTADYAHRLDIVNSDTTWSSTSGIGETTENWTYLIIAVDDSEREIGRSNRFGEYDY